MLAVMRMTDEEVDAYVAGGLIRELLLDPREVDCWLYWCLSGRRARRRSAIALAGLRLMDHETNLTT
jgi:hypothetical protein